MVGKEGDEFLSFAFVESGNDRKIADEKLLQVRH